MTCGLDKSRFSADFSLLLMQKTAYRNVYDTKMEPCIYRDVESLPMNDGHFPSWLIHRLGE